MKNQILSVFFNSDRIYLATLEPTSKGLHLVDFNATDNYYDHENPSDERSLLAAEELNHILPELQIDNISNISITLADESVLITQFPGNFSMKKEELQKLVNFEIRRTYKSFEYEKYHSTIIQMAPRRSGSQMILAVLIQKKILNSCSKLFESLNIPINNLNIAQINAQSAFIYNYPEQCSNTVAILGIQRQFIDLSLIKEGQPIYYNLISMNSKNFISDICKNEFEKLLKDYVDRIDSAYFYGHNLQKDVLLKIKKDLINQVPVIARLNAFRMLSTGISDIEREYCSRNSHIFPPCIGGAIPPYHKSIMI
jgi:hypothetical protein